MDEKSLSAMQTFTSTTALPTTTDALVFPNASHNFSKTLSSLKQATLSITNRLRSIEQDSLFVKHVSDIYQLPLIANERCGSWYIPQEDKEGSAYFKSTDGHQGQWSFSKRRLNLQVLDIIGNHHGCIVVDSTRRGKSMPDALSKTVPIWCAVINRLLFPGLPAAHSLNAPLEVIGPSEHAQIEARLDSFLNDAKALQLDLQSLRTNLQKPLLPLWITQDSVLPALPINNDDNYPVICCTASRRVHGAEASEGGYIQGAGDDSEGWSQGLTPILFWQHKAKLMATPEEELPTLIKQLLTDPATTSNPENATVLILPTQLLHLGTTIDNVPGSKPNKYDCTIICDTTKSKPPAQPSDPHTLHLHCGTGGKLGSRSLRTHLPLLAPLLAPLLSQHPTPKILVACSSTGGQDLSVGVALAILCLYFDDDGMMLNPALSMMMIPPRAIDKVYIRRRLSWITTSKPEANPSRSTLQAVNAFLMRRSEGN
ncbi:hypothetical protein MMC24_004644 [Lignoscripta atroalba]|nr:hypothetical protein [Lignoscripta atroalba]